MNNRSANFVKTHKMNWRCETWPSHTGYGKILVIMLTVRASFFFFFFLLCFVCIAYVFNKLALVTFSSAENMKIWGTLAIGAYVLKFSLNKALQVFLPHAGKKKNLRFGRKAFLFYYHMHISSLCEFIIPSITACLTIEINIYFTFFL